MDACDVKPCGRTVLVAEDEAQLRILLERLLQKQGYTVLAARDGREALEIALHHSGAIDLLLSDIVMPEMSGTELAERLEREFPAIRIVLMSAYADGILKMNERWVFFTKPFVISQLLAALERLLREPRAAGSQ